MQDLLTSALELHGAGRLDSAAELYQQILTAEPDHPDALHLLGVVEHQRGAHARAVERISRAVTLRPNVAAFHANLAEAYRSLGQLERTIGCCRTALQLSPNYAEAHSNLGLAYYASGQHDEAIEHFRRAVELKPALAAAHNNLGIALRDAGRAEEALAEFRQAVELDVNFASAQTNLGQCLLERGEFDAALPHCREAVGLEPNAASLHHNLGNALRKANQLAEARAAYLEALRLNPDLAASQAHLGLVLHREGDLSGALAWLQRATEIEPTNVDYWQYLADLRVDREEFSAAIDCWRQATALAPQRGDLHNSLGWALQEDGHLAEAEEHYRLSLQFQPDFARAQLNFGGLQEALGNLDEAERCFREALRSQPTYALPHARLATLRRNQLPDADLAALEARLADAEFGPSPRARLLFALAQALDGRAQFARAADCLREANALAADVRREQRPYAPQDHERLVDNFVRTFDRDFFSRIAGAGSTTLQPVFVFGLPRSGTTLLEQVLASHSRVCGAGELRLARATFESIPSVVGSGDPIWKCVARLDAATVETLAARHMTMLSQHARAGEDRIVDKMPDNYVYLGLLSALFPRATFIHCRRNLRDVALSCWMTDFRHIRWANEMTSLAHRFRQYERLMEHWGAMGIAFSEFRYEELVTNFEHEAQRLVATCGLEWEAACQDFHLTRRPVRTASVAQVRQPLYDRSLNRWRHYESALPELFSAVSAALPSGETPPSPIDY